MRIRSLALASLIFACALILTSACGGSSSGNGGGSGDCTSVATAVCNKIETCSQLLMKLSYGDVQTCVTRVSMSCTAGTSAPGASVSSSQFAACANAFSGADCKTLIGANFSPAACTIAGSLADGKPCGSSDQCQSAYCSVSSGLCGSCGTRAAAGKACASSAECASGLICNSGSVCAQPVAAGGSCSDVRDCAAGLSCPSGKCAQPLAAGQSCTGGDCDQSAGVFCNVQTNVCQTIQIADAGQPCGIVNGTYVGCSASGHCSLPQGQTQGTCQAHAADGAKCDNINGPTCLAPAVCMNGNCVVSDPTSCQ